MERKIIYLDDAIDALRYAQHRFTVADEAGGMGTVKWSEDVIYFATAERVLAELPSAQPEIIHCRDCKHWQSEEYIGNNNVHTLNIASLPCKNWLTGGDWYCGSAERTDI